MEKNLGQRSLLKYVGMGEEATEKTWEVQE